MQILNVHIQYYPFPDESRCLMADDRCGSRSLIKSAPVMGALMRFIALNQWQVIEKTSFLYPLGRVHVTF